MCMEFSVTLHKKCTVYSELVNSSKHFFICPVATYLKLSWNVIVKILSPLWNWVIGSLNITNFQWLPSIIRLAFIISSHIEYIKLFLILLSIWGSVPFRDKRFSPLKHPDQFWSLSRVLSTVEFFCGVRKLGHKADLLHLFLRLGMPGAVPVLQVP